jgi:molybdate transport system substrate-binding protein
LAAPLEELAARYQRETGRTVRLTFGASGTLFAQISAGAPFDLFFSADRAYPENLVSARLAERGTLFRYGTGRLVLWVPRESKLEIAGGGIEALAGPRVKKVAIANPLHAPYGAAAVAALRNLGLYESLKARLVFGENVAQALQFAQTGAADAALVALSQAMGHTHGAAGRWYELPAGAAPRVDQCAVILTAARGRGRLEEAKAFASWVRGASAQGVLGQYGLAPGDAPE